MNMPLRYLSVCSGIEAASVAWEPLGWCPVAFSEIDAFASAVLAHHYRSVPNWGNMTRFKEWPDAAVDLLVGGTPCQSFSVAGLRKGLDDPRGNLALVYLGLVDRYRPKWVVWENVPGVLSSSKGRDFGAFLGALGQLGYGWAYRVLDAQYIRTRRFSGAVPQRRRRVFVVGYLGDWRPAAAVLFEPESLRGNPPPRREPGQRPAPTLAARTRGGGGLGTDFDLDGGLIPQGFGGGNTSGPIDVAACLTAKGMRIDFEVETFVAHTLRGSGFDASEDGSGRGVPLVPVAFDCKGSQVQVGADGSTPTLRAMGHAGSHANAGGQLAVAFQDRFRGDDGRGYCRPPPASEGATGSLETVKPWCVAFDLRGREGGAMPEGPDDTANIRAASGGSSRSYIATRWAVRRLTPKEAERLQGFPDGYTDVPYRKRNSSADGPRYKALGNSMAVNAMDWLGQRIDYVRAILLGN